MPSPQLNINGTVYNIPEHQGYELKPEFVENKTDSIGGVTLVDKLYYKYGIVLNYDAIHRQDYEALRNLIQNAYKQNRRIRFKFPKASEYAEFTEVTLKLGDPKFRGGSGISNFYYSITLEIRDVNPR